jgi:hypothetical protein
VESIENPAEKTLVERRIVGFQEGHLLIINAADIYAAIKKDVQFKIKQEKYAIQEECEIRSIVKEKIEDSDTRLNITLTVDLNEYFDEALIGQNMSDPLLYMLAEIDGIKYAAEIYSQDNLSELKRLWTLRSKSKSFASSSYLDDTAQTAFMNAGARYE